MRLPPADAPCWWNGRLVRAGDVALRPTDAGVLAGLGVFETLAVRDGRCIGLEPHLSRLADGAARLAVPLPEPETLREAVRLVTAEAAGRHGWVKIVATRGEERMVFGGEVDPLVTGRPASAILLPWRRDVRDPLAGIKSLNFAPFVLGLERARRLGADEGLWCNSRGHLAEGCASNLFVVRQERIFTASPRDGILPGITRAAVIRAARGLGLTVHEGKLRLARLERAAEAFLTSSVLGVRPLVAFRGRPVGPGAPGPVTRAVAAALGSGEDQTAAPPPGTGDPTDGAGGAGRRRTRRRNR